MKKSVLKTPISYYGGKQKLVTVSVNSKGGYIKRKWEMLTANYVI